MTAPLRPYRADKALFAARVDREPDLDLSDEIVAGIRVVALVIIAAVACVAIGLWAINRNPYPSACRDFPTECSAAVVEMR